MPTKTIEALSPKTYKALQKNPDCAAGKAQMHKAVAMFAKGYVRMMKGERRATRNGDKDIARRYSNAMFYFEKMLCEQKEFDGLADPAKNAPIFQFLVRHDGTVIFISNAYNNGERFPGENGIKLFFSFTAKTLQVWVDELAKAWEKEYTHA